MAGVVDAGHAAQAIRGAVAALISVDQDQPPCPYRFGWIEGGFYGEAGAHQISVRDLKQSEINGMPGGKQAFRQCYRI
jgi:hypothetical protein